MNATPIVGDEYSCLATLLANLIAKYADVVIGSEEDFTACLGYEIPGSNENFTELNVEGYKAMISAAAEEYPNFKAVAAMLHTVRTASVNDWKALCWSDGAGLPLS